MEEPKKPDFSCPIIDKIISIENDIMNSLDSTDYDDLDILRGHVEDALWFNGDIETEAEKVREINDDLRKWGEWQEERADSLEELICEALGRKDIVDFMPQDLFYELAEKVDYFGEKKDSW